MSLSHLAVSLTLSILAAPHLGYSAMTMSKWTTPPSSSHTAAIKQPAVYVAPEDSLSRLATMSDAQIAEFGRTHGLCLTRRDLFCVADPKNWPPRNEAARHVVTPAIVNCPNSASSPCSANSTSL